VPSSRCLTALLLAPLAAFAQGASPDAGVEAETTLDESVTSQVASFAVTRLKDSPAVVTVVSAQDIRESGARDLVDVLQLVPGVFLGVDSLGVVGPGFRGLWGHEGKILLLIDGKEMNELLYSTMQLGNEYPVELIERVEVVRGPGSVIYGGNAELAVINVVTRGVQGATDLLVSGTWGQFTEGPGFASSYARRGGVVSGRYVFDSVPGLSAFASGSLGQGQRSTRDYVDPEGTVGSMAGASALDPAVVQAGIGYRDVQATFLYHRYATTSIAGLGLVADPVAVTTFETWQGELAGTFRPTERFELLSRFNVTVQKPWADTRQDALTYYDKTARRLRARLIGRWAPLDELQVTVGGDAMFDNAVLNGPSGLGQQSSFGEADFVDYRTLGAFAELYSENPIVNVAVGARFDANSAVGPSLVPRAVLLRSFGPVQLKALFSLAFRWPGIENLNAGTAALRPERTTVFEFEGGVDITRHAHLSANVFTIGIDAPIVYGVDQASGEELYLNLGKQGTTGGEVALQVRGKWGRLAANYSLYVPTLRADVDTYDAPGRTDMFLGAPAHRGVLTGTVRPVSWLSLSPTVLLYGPKLALGAETAEGELTVEEIPTQVLANFVVRVDDVPVKGLSVSLGIYNIFGTDYRFVQPYAGGYAPMPGLGREVMLRVGYLFEPTFE
jgi:outer membrane receptor protein involved in Fe transport